ncbi:hypothetical protein ACLOJK_008390 [Asimina triloba]
MSPVLEAECALGLLAGEANRGLAYLTTVATHLREFPLTSLCGCRPLPLGGVGEAMHTLIISPLQVVSSYSMSDRAQPILKAASVRELFFFNYCAARGRPCVIHDGL